MNKNPAKITFSTDILSWKVDWWIFVCIANATTFIAHSYGKYSSIWDSNHYYTL